MLSTKALPKEQIKKSAVGLMKDRLTIRLGRTAWMGGGKTDIRV